MKKLLIAATLIALLHSPATGQYSATRLCNESIKLNGGIRSAMGGQSRSYIPLSVPYGTTHIAISITVSPTQQVNGYALTAHLASALSGNVSSIPGLISSMEGVPGTGIIDMLLYNNIQCVNLFLAKDYRQCNPIYWRQNSGGGIFQYAVPYPGTYYLCFRNPSEIDAVYFHVEATAIIAAGSGYTVPTDNTNSNEPTENNNQPNYMRIRYQKQFER